MGLKIKKILEDLEEEDLKIILLFQPQILDRLCYLLSLELQLEKENKIDLSS